MIDVLIGILGILLIFFLPGFFLVLTLFPKKGALHQEFDLLFKATLGIALSILISIIIGIALDAFHALAAQPDGYSPALWASLIGVTLALAIVSWFKGGLKDVLKSVRKRQSESKMPPEEELEQLARSKGELQRKLAKLKGEDYRFDEALKAEAEVKIPAIESEIMKINIRIDEIVAAQNAQQYLEKDDDEKTD